RGRLLLPALRRGEGDRAEHRPALGGLLQHAAAAAAHRHVAVRVAPGAAVPACHRAALRVAPRRRPLVRRDDLHLLTHRRARLLGVAVLLAAAGRRERRRGDQRDQYTTFPIRLHWIPPCSLGLDDHQMNSALPLMFSTGTEPHARESLELPRLSPMTNT